MPGTPASSDTGTSAVKTTLSVLDPEHSSAKTLKLENTEKRDTLISYRNGPLACTGTPACIKRSLVGAFDVPKHVLMAMSKYALQYSTSSHLASQGETRRIRRPQACFNGSFGALCKPVAFEVPKHALMAMLKYAMQYFACHRSLPTSTIPPPVLASTDTDISAIKTTLSVLDPEQLYIPIPRLARGDRCVRRPQACFNGNA
ncbi:hypothetical protein BDV95DRAFT_655397 [Massariosphaeria phaeospora]|uniref:Uncharacterized protein n=1 Tax=Massariosphaeria phaeospora TaxID=100035 RepID=A0A7C8MGJ4_9PLEO|nr:hypothetical protein BDV95DRAFT_655397 [Massariosphaeria phaeospora]